MSRDKARGLKAAGARAQAAQVTGDREMPRALPERPSIVQLKKQARELCDHARASSPDALARVRRHHPRATGKTPFETGALRLSDAQLVIAREYGFASWSKLKRHIELATAEAGTTVARAADDELALILVRDAVLFPGATLVLDIARARSLTALRVAEAAKQPIFCVLQRNGAMDRPAHADLHEIGTIARVMWTIPRANGVRVQVRGLARARLSRSFDASDHDRAKLERLPERALSDTDLLACMLRLHAQLERVGRATERLSLPELEHLSQTQDLPGLIGLAAAGAAPSERQRWLELSDPVTLVSELCAMLEPAAALPLAEPAGPAQSSARTEDPAALLLVLYSQAHPHLSGRSFPLRSACTRIGRAVDNDIVLPSDAVSREHARIERQGEHFVLMDAASTNGTFAGETGEAVQQHALRDGARFAVGDTLLCFLSGSELERKRREVIADLAEHDALTEVLGRTAFQARLEQAVLYARSDEAPLSLLLIGVDRLREHNETHGHLAGDQLLRRIAAALRDGVGSSSLVARYAGDLFALALPRTTAAQARALGDRLRAELSTAELAGPSISVTFSAGVAALYRTTGANELIDAALTALAQSQRDGRGGGQGSGVAA